MSQPETPKQAGYRMPAEWELHARTWMMWPTRDEVWNDMNETRKNYAAVAHAIRDFEPLTMLVRPENRDEAQSLLGDDVDILEHPINDSWARDAGPCFVTNDKGECAGVSFEFNAWGGKYTPFDGDNSAPKAILKAADVPMFCSDLIAEGGGVSVDGQTDAMGRPIRLVTIPDATGADTCGYDDKFCLSYINSYICNGAIIMPEYGVKTDGKVHEIYQDLFPDRRIVQVPIPAIAIGGGGIHCITQQEPLAVNTI